MRCGHWLLALAALGGACSGRGEVREGWEVFSGGLLHWESRGEGHAVVLLHGGGLDLRQWDDEVEWLQARHAVLRYDLRGHGRSAPASAAHAPHEDLRELLDRHGIQRAVLVGHSLGGRIALDFALAHPGRAAGLFLLAPGLSGWSWDAAEMDAWLAPILAAVDAGDRELAVERWLASPFLAPAGERPDVARELRRLARDNAEVWFAPASELALDPPAWGRLSELSVPVRILVGARDAPEMQRVAEALGAHTAAAQVVKLEGAGHALDLERPLEVRAELEAFLAELGW